MKRSLSLLLCILLIGSMLLFTACDTMEDILGSPADTTVADATEAPTEPETEAPKPEDALAAADQSLAETPYQILTTMSYDCDNDELAEVFDAMTMSIPVTVAGNDLHMSMNMTVMGMVVEMDMTVVDQVLYYVITAEGESTKMKCTLTDAQLEEFTGSYGADMPVDYQAFTNLQMEEVNGKQVITCNGLSEAGKAAMNALMSESLTGTGAQVSMDELSYSITLNEEKYEYMNLSCTYNMTIEGQSYAITMHMGAAYTYDNITAPTVPADADQYLEMNYSDILG